MAYAVGGIVATIYLPIGLLLVVGAISVSDLALCSDPAGVAASGEDDCIDSSSLGRAVGLALAYESVLAAFATVALGVIFARRREARGAARRHGRRHAAAGARRDPLPAGQLLT